MKLLLAMLLISTAIAQDLKLSSKIYQNKDLPFISHQGSGDFENYLSMNINYSPVKELLKQWVNKLGKPLKNRGEAHITVITPIEFSGTLKRLVTQEEIDQMAINRNIQGSSFDVTCLGSGKAGRDATYFIVVESSDLLEIRKDVQKLFVHRGGDPLAFDPSSFHPHITLGFTSRDLHQADGVVKDKRSCLNVIEIVKSSK